MKQRCLSDEFIAVNNKWERFAMGFYVQWKEGERELDSGDTERVCAGEAECLKRAR